ncbi:hypothetical protein [Cognatiyoonia sp. IB215182]|uniref:hypothetical protein n=1 Tax=Cognatiyoonia sp. IB215182 TaxID=3097353 RepID=UPI002A10D382|nr:hypothetical protein [Cognatiyoonia sp. IB215182]MDX8351660.1 hypothetical protein [Cognatiyoonia sp. IB215182]
MTHLSMGGGKGAPGLCPARRPRVMMGTSVVDVVRMTVTSRAAHAAACIGWG